MTSNLALADFLSKNFFKIHCMFWAMQVMELLFLDSLSRFLPTIIYKALSLIFGFMPIPLGFYYLFGLVRSIAQAGPNAWNQSSFDSQVDIERDAHRNN